MCRIISVALIGLLFCSLSISSEVTPKLKAFTHGSLKQIESAHTNESFLLVLWSIDCPPCLKELELISKTKKDKDEFNVVFISTDPLTESKTVQKILASYDLLAEDNWIFAEEFVERLRFEIDPNWAGTLPQAYFYEANHQRTSVAGTLDPKRLKNWTLKLEK